MIPGDRDRLSRFVEAQADGVFDRALAEIEAGRKSSHWMWFIFPQHVDLGRSATARFYGLTGVEEARAYLDHPLLGLRLRQAAAAALRQLEAGVTARDLLGPVDAMKLSSSMHLFGQAAPEERLFRDVQSALASSS